MVNVLNPFGIPGMPNYLTLSGSSYTPNLSGGYQGITGGQTHYQSQLPQRQAEQQAQQQAAMTTQQTTTGGAGGTGQQQQPDDYYRYVSRTGGSGASKMPGKAYTWDQLNPAYQQQQAQYQNDARLLSLLPNVLQNRELALSQGKDFRFGQGFEDLISRIGSGAVGGAGGAGGLGAGGDINLEMLMREPEIMAINQLYDLGAERVRRQVGDEMQRAGLLQSGFNIEELTNRQEDLEARRAGQIGPIAQRIMEEMQAGVTAQNAGLLGAPAPAPLTVDPSIMDLLQNQKLI
jgi:hypothetical protein